MGLDYVDIFYSHRFDPDTPLEETMGALDTAVRQGKALYAGISSYSAERTARGGGDPARARHAAAHPPALLLDAQPLDRGRTCSTSSGEEGVGCIAFSPLAQGMLTDQVPRRRPGGLARGARAASSRGTCSPRRTCAASARSTRSRGGRGQTLAQMAIAWVLRDPRVTSALIGASSVEQLEQQPRALGSLEFSRRRAGRDRPPRRRGRHQPLGGVEQRLTPRTRAGLWPECMVIGEK